MRQNRCGYIYIYIYIYETSTGPLAEDKRCCGLKRHMPEFRRLANEPEATRHQIVIQDIADNVHIAAWLVMNRF